MLFCPAQHFTCLPKKVQHIIITVAKEPRFDGDKNPSNAKTAERDKDVSTSVCATGSVHT